MTKRPRSTCYISVPLDSGSTNVTITVYQVFMDDDRDEDAESASHSLYTS